MTTKKQDTTLAPHEAAVTALLAVRDQAALIELSGQQARGRNLMTVVVALARCLGRVDDQSLGLLATKARELLRDPLGSDTDEGAWYLEQDWKSDLVDRVEDAIQSGAAEDQRWLARCLRRRLTVNRFNPPTPLIAMAMLEDEPVTALEKLDKAIANELGKINTGPQQENARKTAVDCLRAALTALGADADERKSWLEFERSRGRRRAAVKR